MVSFYAFPVIFIDTVLFKKGTLINRVGVRTPWTHPLDPPLEVLVQLRSVSAIATVSTAP